jgi:mRNA interferase YafQ
MIFKIIFTGRFKKDVKLLQRRGYNMNLLKETICELEENGQLSDHFLPHKLSGGFTGYWEAHLKPDWLLIWKVIPEKQEIWLTRTGTHSDLF